MAYQHQNLQQKIISQQQQLSFFLAQQQKMNEISVQVAGIRDRYNGGGAVGQDVSYSGGRDSVDYRDGGGYYGGGLDQERGEENWLARRGDGGRGTRSYEGRRPGEYSEGGGLQGSFQEERGDRRVCLDEAEKQIIIQGLPADVKIDDLAEFCRSVRQFNGGVLDVLLHSDILTGEFKGVATVTYVTPRSAREAVEYLDGINFFCGPPVRVRMAQLRSVSGRNDEYSEVRAGSEKGEVFPKMDRFDIGPQRLNRNVNDMPEMEMGFNKAGDLSVNSFIKEQRSDRDNRNENPVSVDKRDQKAMMRNSRE